GTLNTEPADERTTLPPRGSTESPARTTPPAPRASVMRMIVPAFPGSLHSTGTTNTPDSTPAAIARSNGDSTAAESHTAKRPAVVTVSASEAAAESSMSDSVRPEAAMASPRSRCRSTAASVANASTIAPARAAASTDLNPSPRKGPALRRAAARWSLVAETTRGVLAVKVSTGRRKSSAMTTRLREGECLLGGRGVDVLRQRGLGGLDQGGEGRGVVDGELGQV